MIVLATQAGSMFTCKIGEWITDTATFYHATSNRELFSTYTEGNYGAVRTGNSSSSLIKGIDDINITTNLGFRAILKDEEYTRALVIAKVSRWRLYSPPAVVNTWGTEWASESYTKQRYV